MEKAKLKCSLVSGTELEVRYLRSGRIFQSGKRRKTMIGRGSCSTNRGEYYDLMSHIDKGPLGEF